MKIGRLIVIAVLAPLVVALVLILYTWPSARSAPRHVPVGLVASATQADSVAGKLGQPAGQYDVHRYDSRAEAVTALRHRDIDAAIVLDGSASVLVASADGPVLSMQIKPALTDAAGSQAKVTDVVATPSTDPKGAVLGQAVLPLTLAGELSAILLALTVLPGWRQLVPFTVISAATGLLCVLITDTWLDVLGPATWWIAAGVFSLTVLAIGSIVLGLHALLGRIGLPIAFATLVFLGNAFSGASSAPELLPTPVKIIGQWLPPGAGDQLLRSAAFFHGHGFLHPTIVLAVWVVLGFGAVLAGKTLSGRRSSAGRHEQSGANAATQPAAG